MSDPYFHSKLNVGDAKSLAEAFAPIGEAMLSEAERAKRANQEQSAAIQDDASAPVEQTPYEEKMAKVRQLRAEGKHAEAAQVASTITDAERKEAFGDLLEERNEKAKNEPRDWTGLPLNGGPGTPQTKG